MTKFVLRYQDPGLSHGTYFCGFTPIGPLFGGTLEKAERYGSREEAAQQIGRHWAMGACEIEEVSE